MSGDVRVGGPLLHLPLRLSVVVQRRLVARMTSMAGVMITSGEDGTAFVACPTPHVAWNAARILHDEGLDARDDGRLVVVQGWRRLEHHVPGCRHHEGDGHGA